MIVPAPTVRFPTSTAAALGLLAVLGGGVAWVLARFWGANPEYADRFLILAAAGWTAWAARPDLAALPPRPSRLGYLPLLMGSAAFPVGWFLQAQVNPKPIVLWWIMGAWLLAAAGMVLLLGGPRYLRRLAFPIGFLLFALPIPDRIHQPLQTNLQDITTTAAAAVLPLLGVPVDRSGFILSLQNGDLGVAEACSGVRSITALTAIAAFVAYQSGFGFLRGAALLVLSIPVIATVNATRVVTTGLIQEFIGPEYIVGDWHEALGIAMVLLGLVLVVGLAKLMGRRATPTPSPTVDLASPHDETPGGVVELPAIPHTRSPSLAFPAIPLAVVLLSVSGTAASFAEFLGRGVEREMVAAAPLDQIPTRLGPWQGKDMPIPDYVTEMLTYDAAFHRLYTRDMGYEADAWVLFWSSRNMVKGYHHPDVCWGNRGFRQASRDLVPVRAGGGELPITVREFTRKKGERQLILYWCQEGRKVWTEADEQQAFQLSDDQHGWVGERLFRTAPAEASGRLVILISAGISANGTVARKETIEFSRLLADAVYQVCPWAALAP